jgi:hypothetical protein
MRHRATGAHLRRRAATLAIAFVASLVAAAYGHCWPMFAAQIHQVMEHHHGHDGHDGGAPLLPHEHGPELMVAGVAAAPPADVDAPISKVLPPISPTAGMLPNFQLAPIAHGAYGGARAGPFAFRDIHARTGRLLI